MFRALVVGAAMAAMIAVPLAARATLEEPIGDIRGTWSGTGFVQKNAGSRPITVRCTIDGEQNGVEIGFGGECRALLVMKRAIGAHLVRDGNRLTGTYVGSDVGVAQLDGGVTPSGSVVLTMTFPRDVNGDDRALMMIDRPDEHTFTITTVDSMLTGEEVTTAQITFARD